MNASMIYCAEEFGFKSASALSKLGMRPVGIKVDLGPFPPVQRMLRLTPTKRRTSVLDYFRGLYDRVRRSSELTHIHATPEMRGFTCTIPAKDIVPLSHRRGVQCIWVRRVSGRRKRKRRDRVARWYAVKAMFAIQVENQTRGIQEYEERILLVRASGCKGAVRQLRQEFQEYAKPYVNIHYQLVRWKFERVVEIREVMDSRIQPKGTEVYSCIRRRKLTSDLIWKRS